MSEQSLSVTEAIRLKRAVRNYTSTPASTEAIEQILKAGRRAQSSKNDQPWVFIVVSEPEQLKRLSGAGSYAAHMINSAFTIVIAAPAGYDFDLGQAAAYMQLAAVEQGIGSCVTSLHNADVAREVLGVPADLTCKWSITFGYPDQSAQRPLRAGGRRPLDEMVRYERYS